MRRREIIEGWGFVADPFSSFIAESEQLLHRSFVVPNYFDEIVGDHQRPQPAFVFGSRGEGKSTLCRMVTRALRERDNPPLVVVATDFSGWPVDKLEALTLDDHVWRILGASVAALVEALEADEQRLQEVAAPDLALLAEFVLRFLPALDHHRREKRVSDLLDRVPSDSRLQRYSGRGYRRLSGFLRRKRIEFERVQLKGDKANWLLAALMLVTTPTSSHQGFAGATVQNVFDVFLELVRRIGYPSLYVLIDKIDEIDAVAARPDRLAKLVAPLAKAARFLESEGLGLKLFLPEEVRHDLSGIRYDRIRTRRIEWSEVRLKTFLRARVRAYTENLHESLEHVFESYSALEPRLLRASAQAPRNMLRILDHIISEHCERERPPERVADRSVKAGLKIFTENRMLESDAELYRRRLDAWDREHQAEP